MTYRKVSGRTLLTYRPVLLAYAMQFTDNRVYAEDLVQDTFEAYLKHTGRHPDPGKKIELRRFLKTTLKRIFFNEYKKRKRQERHRKQRVREYRARATQVHASVTRQAAEAMEVIHELPRARRNVFLLYLHGYQSSEIAAITGIPIATVRTQVFYIKKSITTHLKNR